MIKVIDNFLEKEYFDQLFDAISSDMFPWYLQHSVSTDNDGHIQMTHNIYKNSSPQSDLYDLMDSLIDRLNICAILRIKVNLLHRTDKAIEHGWHIDITDAPHNAKTGVLYLNTNNGYTKFISGEKIESVSNRMVIFPNSLRHTGSTNTCDIPYRLVLNIDYIEGECNGI